MLQLIPKDGSRMTTSDLVDKFYGKNAPYNGQQIVMGAVRRLVDKTALMNGNCRVFKSERAGPKPVEVWVHAKKRRQRASA